MQSRDMYVNQNASLLDQQQYLQGLQNHQQVLFGETLGYNNNQLLNTKFQQDFDYVGSPMLTTNSERSEVTEASSSEFCFQTRLPEFQPQLFPQLQRQQQQKFLNPGMLNRSMFSMGLGSQQLDISRYSTPVAAAANARGNASPQFMYQEPGSLAAKPPSGQSHRSLMQLSDFNSPFLKNQCDLSPVHGSLQQGSGISEAGAVHGLNNGMLSGNLLMGNSQKFDASSKDSSGKQPFQQKGTELNQELVPLDPLEEKILFSMEDSSISEIASGVFGDKFDNVNLSNPFPSNMQSGSWSALMQTAVAEASSSDTGLQEEFSSLTYQNMELPADINDISNFMDSDKQHAACVNNTLQGSGLLNSSFPGFQLPSNQLRSCVFQDENTPDSTQRSSNLTGHWVDCNPQQKIWRGNQQVQSGVSFDNLSTGNMYLQSSGMLDQLPSQTCNRPSSTADPFTSNLSGLSSFDPSQGGKWMNVPDHLRKMGTFPHHIQQNNPATVYPSQMQTVNPFVASQHDNATFPGVQLDTGLGGCTSSQTRSPQQGANRQFNVWMDLPTRQHPSDQESLKAPLNSMSPVEMSGSHATAWKKTEHMSSALYDMPQRVGLPQEQGAAAKNIFFFTASNKDVNKLQGETNMDFSPNSKLYAQKDGLKMPMGSGMSSMSQPKSFVFDDSKMEQNVCSREKQLSGSNTLVSGMQHSHLTLPASASVWFKQMGAFRNDQMQPALDSVDTPDQLTQHSKPLNIVNEKADTIAPEKRKLVRKKQLAWHEEVSNAFQKDHTTSGAEQEWARASKVLVEKAEYDTQTFEFALPLHRSKRRLVLTSKLMQQLFDPSPSFILFSAASSSYSTVSFFVSRAALGDACSLTNKRENALPSSSHEVEKIVEKNDNIERKDMQHSEVAKRLTEKAKKLEESFDRLEKTMSMADIRCEIADMERFSVINRFARFHSKGPVDNNNPGHPSQSSMVKPIPERYIVVRPMPQNLPDGVHCLSL